MWFFLFFCLYCCILFGRFWTLLLFVLVYFYSIYYIRSSPYQYPLFVKSALPFDFPLLVSVSVFSSQNWRFSVICIYNYCTEFCCRFTPQRNTRCAFPPIARKVFVFFAFFCLWDALCFIFVSPWQVLLSCVFCHVFLHEQKDARDVHERLSPVCSLFYSPASRSLTFSNWLFSMWKSTLPVGSKPVASRVRSPRYPVFFRKAKNFSKSICPFPTGSTFRLDHSI